MQQRLKGHCLRVFAFFLIYHSVFGQSTFDKLGIGLEPEILCPNSLSTGLLQWNNWFSNNEREIFYTIEESGRTTLVKRSFNGCQLGDIKKLRFDQRSNYSQPWVNEKGTRVLFQALSIPSDSSDPEIRIMESRLSSNGWTSPVPISLGSADGTYKGSPALTTSGNLYFSSGVPGENLDIHMFDGKETTRLPNTINSEHLEIDFYLDKNEEFIIFSSFNRISGLGLSDLYISFNKDGQWTNAKSLGSVINSEHQDFSPYLTNDRKYLVFTRSYTSFRQLRPFYKHYVVKFDLEDYR